LIIHINRSWFLASDNGTAWAVTYTSSTTLHFICEPVSALPCHFTVHGPQINPCMTTTTAYQEIRKETFIKVELKVKRWKCIQYHKTIKVLKYLFEK